MEDILFHAASEYSKLMETEYFFQCGKKGKLYTINLAFPKDCFHHIAGLKKLCNTYIRKRPRTEIFDKIMNREITQQVLTNEGPYEEVQERLTLTANLKTILESNNTEYLFIPRNFPFRTKIQADFLFVTKIERRDAFLFIAKDEKRNIYFCRSVFFKKNKDYTCGQPKLTLLYKERKNIANGESTKLYGKIRT